MVNRSISFRPRIVVFIFSNINRITTGINKPSAKATNKIFFLTGAIGSIFPVGGVINGVLYDVKAWDNSFSSRFCNRNKYNDSFTFCWRSTDNRYFACEGLAAIRAVVCFSLCRKVLICVLSVTTRLSMDEMIAVRMACKEWSRSITNGFRSLLFATKLLRCNCVVLYSDIWCSILVLSKPELAGSNWFLLEAFVK